ncbi:GtrA family protein [Leuconostoc mesenteroides]|uniref:GtrA family protein n=1 Tax=Leuconostoc mesenteroides TaxID=1245 RepID=UPI002360DE81|nr:GtrA family protein [Leuconostoc mesenteroides]
MITEIKTSFRNEKIRFLIIGIFNTLFGTIIYSLLLLHFNKIHYGYMIALVVSQIVSLFFAFYLHRNYTFKVKGHLIIDLVRFSMVSALSYAVNLIILPILVGFGHFDPLFSQIFIVIITTLISFIGRFCCEV